VVVDRQRVVELCGTRHTARLRSSTQTGNRCATHGGISDEASQAQPLVRPSYLDALIFSFAIEPRALQDGARSQDQAPRLRRSKEFPDRLVAPELHFDKGLGRNGLGEPTREAVVIVCRGG
jgi:hypothetical protein